VAFRLLGQQVAKVVPVLGWLVSGLMGAATTWLVGQAALAYFEGHATPRGMGHLLSDLWQEQLWPWCGRTVGSLLRFCPAVWALRGGRALLSRWNVKRRNARRET